VPSKKHVIHISAARSLAVNAGSFVLSGVSSLFRFNRSIASQRGIFTLSGINAALTYNSHIKSILAQDGPFSLSGKSITLTYNNSQPLTDNSDVILDDGSGNPLTT